MWRSLLVKPGLAFWMGLGFVCGACASVHAQDTCMLADESAAIVMNQTGFEAFGPKLAVLRAGSDTPQSWTLYSGEGVGVLSGTSVPVGFDPSAGEGVHTIEFSDFTTPGEGFRLDVCGARSREFSIGASPYSELAEDSLRYFYLNRLGTDLDLRFTAGDAWARAGGFMNATASCFVGEDHEGTLWPGCDYTLSTQGGWADAGDYGQYAVNGGIAVWTLQYAYERLRSRGELQTQGWLGPRLPLPQSQDGVSDILLEARWQLEFLMGLQIPNGARVWVDARGRDENTPRLIEIDGSGLVHHKLHERAWLPLPLRPEDAQEPRYLYPPSTAATLNLAASAAQCSRLWQTLDRAFSERCLQAAERAFAAAQRHNALFARNTFDGGGAYGDLEVSDEFYWAATELYLTTGEARYLALAENYRDALNGSRAIYWGNTELLAELSAKLHPEHLATYQHSVDTLLGVATDYRDLMEDTPYRYPLPVSAITWGSNGALLNHALILAAAHDLDPEAGFRTGVVNAMDYLLGRNPLDQSYVAGYGDRAMRHPHHRFWAQGADPGFPPAPPGALSGGPNFQIMTDPIAAEMRGQCAPQTCWADHVAAYALNEVAINWNAPLFAVAVFLEGSQVQAD